MKPKLRLPAIVTSLILLMLISFPAAGADPVTITWFIGLGTGTQPDQILAEEAAAGAFNASQTA
ncbi:MAG: hypothetical protein H7X77_06835, partial [Anaerolineae bacterium]|nr:hypothetical protein [Anaerolineae bacterium]